MCGESVRPYIPPCAGRDRWTPESCALPERGCEESGFRHTCVRTGESLQLLLVCTAMCPHAGASDQRPLRHLGGEAKSRRWRATSRRRRVGVGRLRRLARPGLRCCRKVTYWKREGRTDNNCRDRSCWRMLFGRSTARCRLVGWRLYVSSTIQLEKEQVEYVELFFRVLYL